MDTISTIFLTHSVEAPSTFLIRMKALAKSLAEYFSPASVLPCYFLPPNRTFIQPNDNGNNVILCNHMVAVVDYASKRVQEEIEKRLLIKRPLFVFASAATRISEKSHRLLEAVQIIRYADDEDLYVKSVESIIAAERAEERRLRQSVRIR
ncbi:MAG: hypothetical protein KGI45_01535 [Patescibacteria group bacterium]|nr:hypothetical protein [Patescibacteria group bacterium]MDE1940829.1 hypothetical protein [Patescibacteria group bacterium]MDE1966739.1 hypothetical protein [Patescibacteria group bacterium]